jgi:hypothetical protein
MCWPNDYASWWRCIIRWRPAGDHLNSVSGLLLVDKITRRAFAAMHPNTPLARRFAVSQRQCPTFREAAMALQADEVKQILNNGGTITFTRPHLDLNPGNGGVGASFHDRVKGNYFDCKATIDLKSDNIALAAQESDRGTDAVYVVYEGDWATFGDLMSPGYMYSDKFSGCDFFLYRGISGAVTGVHASREKNKFRDPQQYFTRRGVSKPLWHWKTMGAIEEKNLLQYWTAAVFLAIDRYQIDCFALAMKDEQVKKVLDHVVLKDWR